jgi:hypothetical protein
MEPNKGAQPQGKEPNLKVKSTSYQGKEHNLKTCKEYSLKVRSTTSWQEHTLSR